MQLQGVRGSLRRRLEEAALAAEHFVEPLGSRLTGVSFQQAGPGRRQLVAVIELRFWQPATLLAFQPPLARKAHSTKLSLVLND